jgi:hypothetical protein
MGFCGTKVRGIVPYIAILEGQLLCRSGVQASRIPAVHIRSGRREGQVFG